MEVMKIVSIQILVDHPEAFGIMFPWTILGEEGAEGSRRLTLVLILACLELTRSNIEIDPNRSKLVYFDAS